MRFTFTRRPPSPATRALRQVVAGARPSAETDVPTEAAFEAGWRQAMRQRLLLFAGFLAIWVLVIFGRLIEYQVFKADEMRARADNQHLDEVTTPAARGEIVDRKGRILAYSVESATIQANPDQIKKDKEAAEKLCAALGDCGPGQQARLEAAFRTDRKYFEVRKAADVTLHQLEAVRALNLPAVSLVPQTLRYYPNLDVAAHLIGFVGTDNRGLGGIEARLDSQIRGRDGLVLVQSDAREQRMLTRVEQAPTAGATVELTIDLDYQAIVERELRRGVQETRAQGGTVVVMDPQTGELLALANYPSFNPNQGARFSDELRRNPAVQEVYEPGSTFKIVTASAAIEEGVLKPSDLIDTNPGSIKFPGRKPITEAKHHNYRVLTFEDVIVKSSNIGAIRIGLRVGAERMARYMRRFGFGQKLSPDFSGESAGVVKPPSALNDSELASVSMGYNVSVTPIQMAAAFSAVANGGMLYEPHVVRATIRDGVRQPVEPRQLRRAIDPATARTLTSIMEGVVERGTAKAAKLARYQVAGKTGTAAKIVNGVYSTVDYHSSFAGFVPSRKPAFTILVVIDTPRNGQYGGTVAAPIFKRIAEDLLQQAGVPPSINPVPTVIVAEDAGRPQPQPVRTVALPTIQHAGGRMLMPDLRGLGARDALRLLTAAGLVPRVSGTGVVVAQAPEPGEPVEGGDWGVLQLQRPSGGRR